MATDRPHRLATGLSLLVAAAAIGALVWSRSNLRRAEPCGGPVGELAPDPGVDWVPPGCDPDTGWVPIETLLALRFPDPRGDASVAALRAGWRDGYAVMLDELLRFLHPEQRERAFALLHEQTGHPWRHYDDWFRWSWARQPALHPDYGQFKARIYALIDPRFGDYFAGASTVRLDEVRWGGVQRDGIPPLRAPAVETRAAADAWLAPSDVVFGVSLGGEARAYPKRILAWHELVVDELAGVPFHGVYCTLCGAMIVYRSIHAGVHHRLGTSGFLYRSNKLMYDQATRSLWSTLEGQPVIGPLVGQGIRLEPLHVVTTTWGAWRERHPASTVLSLETGHRRDYAEGAAYASYFNHDGLMFAVPEPSTPEADPLPNKAEVFALRIEAPGARPRAYLSSWLREHPAVEGEQAGVPFVILTDASGAHRAYRRGDVELSWAGPRATDAAGGVWTAGEAAIEGPTGERWERLPAHRAFWFGWRAAFPQTELIR